MTAEGTAELAARLTAQQLSGPPAVSPEQVVDRLLAVQAQDARAVRLSIRSRTRGLTASDVDAALSDRRSVVVSWLNRGTLHLVRSQDYWWLHGLTTPQLVTGSERRLRQEGVSPEQAERGRAVVMAAVLERPRTREELRVLLDDAGVPTARQALVHVLLSTSLHADLVRGPVVGGDHAFVSARDWLGDPPPALGRDEALARLARRYLAGHGPASARDLAGWAGTTLGDARRGLAAIADEVVEVGTGGPLPDLLDLRGRAEPAPLPAPRLLGPFDPVLHGWSSRDLVVGAHGHLVTSNGVFRAVALVGGRAVGTWRLDASRAARGVRVEPFEPVSPSDLEALQRDAADVLRFLALPA